MRAIVPALLITTIASCTALFTGCSSTVTKALQVKPAPPAIEFLGAWGTKGNGPGTLDDPRSIAADDFAAIYIADAGKPDRFIHKFTRGGHPLQSFTPLAPLHDPCAAAVDRGGAIYILECSTGVLYTFSQEATLLHGIHTGLAAAQKPFSLAIDNDGRIYIATSRFKRVMMFTPRGGALGALGGKLPKPQSPVNADQVATAPDGTLFVADTSRRWIARVSSDGSEQNSWTWNAAAPSAGETDAVFFSATPKYVVVLTNKARAPTIHLFAPTDGQEKLTKPLQELDPSLTNLEIKGMAVTPDGELLILDAAAPRVLRFRLN